MYVRSILNVIASERPTPAIRRRIAGLPPHEQQRLARECANQLDSPKIKLIAAAFGQTALFINALLESLFIAGRIDLAESLAKTTAEGATHRDIKVTAAEIYAKALQLKANYSEAEAFLEGTKGIDPRLDFLYAVCLLERGDYERGWTYFESRYSEKIYREIVHQNGGVLWTGQALEGKKLLVFHEQGYGDFIQFARFLLSIDQKSLVISCPQELGRLIGASFPGVPVLCGDEFPRGYDFYCSILSLPLILQAQKNFWQQAYITLTESGKFDFLGKGIVFSWSGNRSLDRDVYRSLPRSVAQQTVDGFRAQPWLTSRAEESLPNAQDVSNLVFDFHDTAELISHCQTVVTVDTSVAHLAGAMGVRTYLLLAKGGEWRWPDDGQVWYPSIRPIRQERLGEWTDVVERLHVELAADRQAGDRAARNSGVFNPGPEYR